MVCYYRNSGDEHCETDDCNRGKQLRAFSVNERNIY